MRTLVQTLNDLLQRAFEREGLDPAGALAVPSRRPDLCDFQCNAAFAAANRTGRKPMELARVISRQLEHEPILSKVSVDGPGFINLELANSFLATFADDLLRDPRLGCPTVDKPMNVIVDFGGPNVAKPMHVGHVRSTIIGDALQRLFRFIGHRVTSDIHLGDWGTQMGMLICETERRMPHLPYFDSDFSGPYPRTSPVSVDDLAEMYPVAASRCAADSEAMEAARLATAELQANRAGYRALWQHFVSVSQEDLRRDFHTLGVSFDLWLGESSVQIRIGTMIESLTARGFTTVSDGALVLPLDDDSSHGAIPPLILQKSDGAAMYGTTDLATVDLRVKDLGADLVLYVVDTRQSLHFRQVFEAARRTGLAGDARLEHINFGTVNGEDGKPFRTRAGGVMRLRDLLDMACEQAARRMADAGLGSKLESAARARIAASVGVGAVKFTDLIHDRTSDYVFQLGQFTSFEGSTGPYLQYAAVRMKAILRKAAERGMKLRQVLPPQSADRGLILMISRFPEAVYTASTERAPHYLAQYAHELATTFSTFYHTCHVLGEADPAWRGSYLSLIDLTLRTLERTLSLLGIDVLDQM